MNNDEKKKREELDAELARLNKAVDDAVDARTRWMNEHMADYAKYPIGTELVDLDTGLRFGIVTEHYRYHAGQDWRYDTSMWISYRVDSGDNTSRLAGTGKRVGSVAEYRDRLERDLAAFTLSTEQIENYVTALRNARAAGEAVSADQIIAHLRGRGITIEETAEGIRWKKG